MCVGIERQDLVHHDRFKSPQWFRGGKEVGIDGYFFPKRWIGDPGGRDNVPLKLPNQDPWIFLSFCGPVR